MKRFPALLRTTAFGLFAAYSSGARADDTFSLKDTPGEFLDVLRGGKLLARYLYAHDISTPAKRLENYKPFLQIYDEAGNQPITKGAGGVLPHHRGIYIGWNGIKIGDKTYDRWHMKGGDQVHKKFTAQTATADQASFTSLVRWEGEKPEETIIEEERTLTFLPPVSPAYEVVDMSSKLKAVAGDTFLNRDLEHSGLQYRPADKVDRKQTTYLYPKAEAAPHKDRDYPWFGETYAIGAKKYSVVYLSHPSNPRDASTSAYRDYGRFGQTWSLTIPSGSTQEFRARFLIVAGEMLAPEVIQKAWNEYAGTQAAVPPTTTKQAEYSSFEDPNNPKATPAPKP